MEMYNIRKAKQGDEIEIINLIKELAEYEKEAHQVKNTPEQLALDLFQDKICQCFVVEAEQQIIAMALYYISYSTWYGKSLYLEDIYIQPKYRRQGIGKKLFTQLIEEARTLKCKRMDWQVLEWNESAIQFYQSIGAKLDGEWINGRIYL